MGNSPLLSMNAIDEKFDLSEISAETREIASSSIDAKKGFVFKKSKAPWRQTCQAC
uniref:Transcriptional regulator n=1 Tax=Heterorhabditis bacteriophora TaxID=37862 RepID=A0A1I7WLS2_HETBA